MGVFVANKFAVFNAVISSQKFTLCPVVTAEALNDVQPTGHLVLLSLDAPNSWIRMYPVQVRWCAMRK